MLPRATLAREALWQGHGARVQSEREALDQKMHTAKGCTQHVGALQLELALEPITLGIELDAWNIPKRTDWSLSARLRAAGTEPAWWHWVYLGTCFRLSQRAQTASGRPVLLSGGYVMTRGGIDSRREPIAGN